MVALVVLPYLWMVTITFSIGRPMRSAVDSMMRLLAWCGTSQSIMSARRLLRAMISPATSAILAMANL